MAAKEPSFRCCTTTLGQKTKFKGTLRFSSSLQIEGQFEGTIQSDGFLGVGDNAVVKADIEAKAASIAGKVLGNVSVQNRLEIYSTAVVHGNVKADSIRFEDGMELVGGCEMVRKPGSVDIFSTETEKLKAALVKECK